VFIAIVCVLSVPPAGKKGHPGRVPRVLAAAPALCLFYSLVVFTFMYGNALAAQDEYIAYRSSNMAMTLSRLSDGKGPVLVKMDRTIIGYSPVVTNMAKDYQVINRLVPNFESARNFWASRKLANNYGMEIIVNNNLDDTGWPVLEDSYYWIIRGENSHFSITMKH
jgi:hypothetical protein